MDINRFCSFSTQRAIFAAAFSLLPISLSVGVLWNHLDFLNIFVGIYLILTKCGLLMVELTAIFFLVWELSAKDKALNAYCFFANIVIVLMMLVHVGAIFQYDSGLKKIEEFKTQSIENITEPLRLDGTLTAPMGDTLADQLNKITNVKLKSRDVTNILESQNQAMIKQTEEARKLILEQVQKASAESETQKSKMVLILPLWYIESGTMYIIPILVAFLLGVGALFISRTSESVINNQSITNTNNRYGTLNAQNFVTTNLNSKILDPDPANTDNTDLVNDSVPPPINEDVTVIGTLPTREEIINQLRGTNNSAS